MKALSMLASSAALAAALVACPALADEAATVAEAELRSHLASAQRATVAGDADGAVRAYDAIAAFYRRGGDEASAAAADFEAARLLFAQDRFDDAHALLDRSEGHDGESARLAQRQHMRAFVLERRGDAAGARRVIAAVNRKVSRDDWNRYLAEDAERLGVPYGWPTPRRRTLNLILALEWSALVALVIVVYRRAVRQGVGPRSGDEGRRV